MHNLPRSHPTVARPWTLSRASTPTIFRICCRAASALAPQPALHSPLQLSALPPVLKPRLPSRPSTACRLDRDGPIRYKSNGEISKSHTIVVEPPSSNPSSQKDPKQPAQENIASSKKIRNNKRKHHRKINTGQQHAEQRGREFVAGVDLDLLNRHGLRGENLPAQNPSSVTLHHGWEHAARK